MAFQMSAVSTKRWAHGKVPQGQQGCRFLGGEEGLVMTKVDDGRFAQPSWDQAGPVVGPMQARAAESF
jgi:hypothetical protein